MRFVPALLLSLALYLPTTAYPKGGHGGQLDTIRKLVTVNLVLGVLIVMAVKFA